jgi:hypothetical protein
VPAAWADVVIDVLLISLFMCLLFIFRQTIAEVLNSSEKGNLQTNLDKFVLSSWF